MTAIPLFQPHNSTIFGFSQLLRSIGTEESAKQFFEHLRLLNTQSAKCGCGSPAIKNMELASEEGAEKAGRYNGLLETGRPSQVNDDYWIWAFNHNAQKPSRESNKCGKWLIFENVDSIDEAWDRVKKAMSDGKLGHTAKVSTMKDKQERGGSVSESVICVYTYDWTDEKDVSRVRNALRSIGFQKKLPYKSDEDTLAGNYAAKGKRVSKYYY